MKWKTLGNALLITTGLFCIMGGVLFLTRLFPWLSVAGLFILVVLLIYNAMVRDEMYDSDNDRKQWFSNDEDENEEEEE